MNSPEKTDLRVIKTKKAIRNAFAELLSEKDIQKITIKDIADTAVINRKTFYNYYAGVYSVVDEIENEIIMAFIDALRDVDFKQLLHEPYEIFKKLTTIINSDFDFYSHLMKMDSNTSLISKIIQALEVNIKKSFSEQISMNKSTLDLVFDYAIAGMITVYQKWFNSDRTESIEEISKALSIIVSSGVNGLLENGI
ncbi:MAG: TetR-like C-terminal domain-containing protein [Smithella sp.]